MFDLTWHTYTDHLREMLHGMMTSDELTDVTLVAEDKKHYKAHKVVLSACSKVFKSIIGDNYSLNPIIYLRGILSYELESILQFIYLGQATFYQERMNEFLNVGKSLEIKAFSKYIEVPGNDPPNDIQSNEFEEENILPLSQSDTQPLSEPNITKDEENILPSSQSDIQPLSEPSTTKYKHKKETHEGLKCSKCNYKATQKCHLQQHINAIHEGVKYPCDQCNYKASRKENLQRHIHSNHEGAKKVKS